MHKRKGILPDSDNDMLCAVLAKRLADLKKRHHMTTAQLAQRTGVPVGTLNKILSGETKRPSLENMQRIAQVFQVPVHYFVGEPAAGGCPEAPEQDQAVSVSREECSLLDGFRKIPRRDQRLLISMVRTIERIYVNPAEPAKVVELPYWVPTCRGGSGMVADAMALCTIAVREDPAARRSDFALQVRGDALVPAYYPDTILGVADTDVSHDQLGVFQLNGEIYVRRFYCHRQLRKLIAINRQYPVIPIGERDHFQCLGRVVGALIPCRPSTQLR